MGIKNNSVIVIVSPLYLSDKACKHLASAIAKVGVDALWTLLTKKVADEIGKTVDNVDRVDEVHAHHDPDLDPLEGLIALRI